jgi:hypothetical protein
MNANYRMPLPKPVLKNTLLRAIFILCAGLLPLLVGVGLFRVLMNANLSATTPTWSDEIYYWHQAYTFREVGFQGGYYTVNEQPAPAAFTRYYAWGAAVPLVYGIQGRLVGWSLHSIPLLNMLWFSASISLFLWLIQANRWQIILTASVSITFVPFLLFSASSMLEIQQQSIAVLFAAVFFRMLNRTVPDKIAATRQWILLMALMAIAIMLRPTWAILFVPLAMLAIRKPTLKTGMLAFIVGVVLFIFSGWLTQLMAAPDVKFVQSLLAVVRNFPLGSIPVLGLKVIDNIQNAVTGHPIEIHNRVMLFLLLGSLAVAWLSQRVRQKNIVTPQSGLSQPEVLFHLYNIGVILVFNLILYDTYDWRDYRVMTPHLLLSLLLLVACQRYRLLAVLLVAMSLILPLLPATYRSPEWYGNHANTGRQVAIRQWSDQFADIMVYQPHAKSPWCNTVLHTPYYLFVPIETLLAIPPGIGISAVLDEASLVFPLKSRYVLLENAFYEQYADQLNLQPLLPVPNGMLSLNQAADCGGG